ncbi:hypothetical protein GCM10027174_44930 [Salinifilum aidingensis]
MTTSIVTSPTLLPLGTTTSGEPAQLHLGDRPGSARHGLIVGGPASGKTVLLRHLARHAETRMPLVHAHELVPYPLDALATPTNGLVLLDNPAAVDDEDALHGLLDRADARGAAVVATTLSTRGEYLAESVQQRLSTGGCIWLHHRQTQHAMGAPVDVTSLARHGHGYLATGGELVEFRFGLHSAEVSA